MSKAPAEKIWIAYIVVLAALTLGESLVRPEVGIDAWMDAAILIVALPGTVVASCLSAYLAFRRADRNASAGPGARVAIGWLLGPMLGFASILAINSMCQGDIDGGMLLFYQPILGILLTVLVLPVLELIHRWRTGKARAKM